MAQLIFFTRRTRPTVGPAGLRMLSETGGPQPFPLGLPLDTMASHWPPKNRYPVRSRVVCRSNGASGVLCLSAATLWTHANRGDRVHLWCDQQIDTHNAVKQLRCQMPAGSQVHRMSTFRTPLCLSSDWKAPKSGSFAGSVPDFRRREEWNRAGLALPPALTPLRAVTIIPVDSGQTAVSKPGGARLRTSSNRTALGGFIGKD